MNVNNNVVLIGESGSGKSWLINNLLYKNVMKYQGSNYNVHNTVFYQNTAIETFVKFMESNLEVKRKGSIGAEFGKKVIFFIDDIAMCRKDRFGEQHVLEVLRQYFDHHQWYDVHYLEKKNVDDI